MKLYSISKHTGYNPLLFLTYMFRSHTFCIFTYSSMTIYRATINVFLSLSALSAIAFSINIPHITGYGLLVSSLIFILNLFIFVRGVISSRYCGEYKPKVEKRAPDIYAMEWFLVYLVGATVCTVGAGYFESTLVIVSLRFVGIFVFCFSVLPFFGDQITAKLEKAGH